MGDAGVGYQPFDVGLGKGHDGTVDDADQAKHHGVGGKLGGRLGEERQGKTQQTVGGGFEQNTGEIHRTCSRRLTVGIRQPAVQRHQRHLDREGDKEAQHQQPLNALAHRGIEQLQIVEGEDSGGMLVGQHQPDDGHQHDKAAHLGVDEELGRGVDP